MTSKNNTYRHKINGITARLQRDYGSLATRLRLVVAVHPLRTKSPLPTDQESAPYGFFRTLLLLFVLLGIGIGDVWGQTSYSGTYYIASVGYDGNPANTNNFYLCPTKGWCSYKATDDFEAGDNMPFLTTYRCKTKAYADGANNAVWYVEKHPTLNYYYIKQASTGRYLTSNGEIRTTGNPDRMRVHLESVATSHSRYAVAPSQPPPHSVMRPMSTSIT
jgi:hypothetical protein